MTGVTNIVSQLAPHLDVVEKQPPNYEYDQHLGRWRANVHRRLGKIVEKESEVIARLQVRSFICYPIIPHFASRKASKIHG